MIKFKEYLNENLTNFSFIDELTTFIESWIKDPFCLEKKVDAKGYPIRYLIYEIHNFFILCFAVYDSFLDSLYRWAVIIETRFFQHSK